MWAKEPKSRCTMKFDRGRMMKIIRPQSVLGDGIPHHVYASVSQDLRKTSMIRLKAADKESTESDNQPEVGAEAEPLSLPLQRSTLEKDCCHAATLVIMRSGGCNERNDFPKRTRKCLACRVLSGMKHGRSWGHDL